MTRVRLAAAVLMLVLVGTSSIGAHDVFRFVGTVIRWDAKRQGLEIRTTETWDGKTAEYTRWIVLEPDCRVMRLSQEVKRSELKPGLFVIVDAVGYDITDLQGTEVEIKPVPPAPKKKKS